MFEDMWERKADIQVRLLEAEHHQRGKLVTALASLTEILEGEGLEEGFTPSGDPLADQWERDILEGRDPDFDLTVGELDGDD